MARAQLRGFLAAAVALVPRAALVAVLARVGDLAHVAVVGVDAAELAATLGDDALDVDVSRAAVARAVTAAAEELAVVLDEEVVDVKGAAAVELEHLVRGLEGAATVDRGGARGHLEGGRVLAYIGPPDVVQGALNVISIGCGIFLSCCRCISGRSTYHLPLQWTPSPEEAPMITLERVAPSSRMKEASFSPVSLCPLQVEAAKVSMVDVLELVERQRTVTLEALHATVVGALDGDGSGHGSGAGRLGQGGGDGRDAGHGGEENSGNLHLGWCGWLKRRE